MATSEHPPSPADGPQSAAPGMPFHWAMAFAFLIFVAMWVAFWCGHSFTLTAMEKAMLMQHPVDHPPLSR